MSESTEPRWYSVNNMGMATLCADRADAEKVASDCNIKWPRQAPHRAMQLVDVSELEKERAARIEAQVENEALKSPSVGKTMSADYVALKARQAGIAAVTPEITMFAELLTRSERTARIEAQQRLADMQELAARSGLAHRMAVQRCVQAAVAEAVAAEREACAELMEQQHTWITNVAASALIRARGTP